jgi:2-keto-4-pentenoate hydratase/2-oxohepta-3-ene-1,7-dioic acid hydratase in catechol pathway
MKIVVFGPEKRVGALQGEDVIDLNGAYARYARQTRDERLPYAVANAQVPSDLEQFIAVGHQGLEGAQQALEHVASNRGDVLGLKGERLVIPAGETKLHAPLAHRGVKIAMAGANYVDHLFDMMRARNPDTTYDQVREESRKRGIGGFWKLSAFVVSPEDEIAYPAKTRYLDYEGEVSIVIGKTARDASAGDLLDHIWGYTLQNDWSARDQVDASIGGLAYASQKNWDGSSSIGPCIVVGEISDPQNVPFQTRVNGELRQDGNTRDMTFSFAEYIEYITRDITFNPGDMISAGTCKGTAMDQTRRVEGGFENDRLFLNVGDVVEVSSPVIGTLRNKVVAKR